MCDQGESFTPTCFLQRTLLLPHAQLDLSRALAATFKAPVDMRIILRSTTRIRRFVRKKVVSKPCVTHTHSARLCHAASGTRRSFSLRDDRRAVAKPPSQITEGAYRGWKVWRYCGAKALTLVTFRFQFSSLLATHTARWLARATRAPCKLSTASSMRTPSGGAWPKPVL